ncbi:beta-lactamase superfamily protein [Ceratobasidium sp. AG-Ba]|nr:beta-lactamase superfamily protein [Ceratobasidium sp. AG-Ba]
MQQNWLSLPQIVNFRWHIIEKNKPFKVDGIDIDITPVAVHHGQRVIRKSSVTPAGPSVEGVKLKAALEPYFCFGFMFADTLVYMSDVSYIPQEAWDVIAGRSASFKAFVVDCLLLDSHISHFGIKDVVESAKRIRAQKTYMVGFGHEIPHDGWEAVCRKIEGDDVGEVSTLVKNAVERVVELGVGIEETLWIRPAYDGQLLAFND